LQPSKLPLPEALCCAPLAMQHPTNAVPHHHPHHFGDSSSLPHLCSPPLATGTDRPLSPLEQEPLSLDLHSCSNPESVHSYPLTPIWVPQSNISNCGDLNLIFLDRRSMHSATSSKHCFLLHIQECPSSCVLEDCWHTNPFIPHTCVAEFPYRTAMCWSHNICNFASKSVLPRVFWKIVGTQISSSHIHVLLDFLTELRCVGITRYATSL
jgi:hypothetical protein